MAFADMKVGQLSKRSGVSVRTLHYYHELGLLTPSLHSPGGHRLYSRKDVERLQQIRSLQELGMSLSEVRTCLDEAQFSPLETVEKHVKQLEEQLALSSRLHERLIGIQSSLKSRSAPNGNALLETLEAMNAMESYFTDAQLESLRQRREQLGVDAIENGQANWQALIEAVREQMEAGALPESDAVRPLAKRWRALIEAFSGGDAAIEQSVANMARENPRMAADFGNMPDMEMMSFMGKACAALKQ